MSSSAVAPDNVGSEVDLTLLAGFVLGCGQGPEDSGPTSETDAACPAFAAMPSVSSSDTCPLVPIVSIGAPRPVTLSVSDASHTASSPLGTLHAVPLFDFVAGQATTFHVEAVDEAGCVNAWDLPWTAPALPDLWPDQTVAVGQSAAMSPGLTVMPVGTLMPGGDHYLAAFDATGAVHWLYDGRTTFDDFEVTADHTVLFMDGDGLTEMDWACTPIAQFTPEGGGGIGIEIPGTVLFHHEGSKLPDGTYLVLDHEFVELPDFPTNYFDLDDTEAADVDDSVVVRFDATGAVLERVRFSDVFDQSRIGWDALGGGEAFPGAYDWVHGNAAQWLASENQYLLSARQQDAVILWDADTDEVVWVLANPDNWSNAYDARRLDGDGSVDWFYHQHAPWLDGDTLILFDNGNVRTSPPDSPSGTPYSRAVGYRIGDGTVSQEWSYEGPSSGEMYCSAGGDVDTLPNGNILAVCSYGKTVDGVEHDDVNLGNSCARVLEFDPATGDTVYDLLLTSDRSEDFNGWYTVRASRTDHIGP